MAKKCVKCNHRPAMTTTDKSRPAKRYDWIDDSNNKRFNVFYPSKETDHCYLCSKEHHFKATYPLSAR